MLNCHEVSRESEEMFGKSDPLVTLVIGLYIACEPASKLVERSLKKTRNHVPSTPTRWPTLR